MQPRSLWRGWPLLVVALATACEETTPGTPTGTGGSAATGGTAGNGGTGGTGGTGGAGGTGGSAPKDAGVDTGPVQDSGTDGGKSDVTIPPGDGGLSPCALDLPNVLDRPPSGALPCDLLPPNFVSP